MSKVIYENIHTGQRGSIEADKYEAFARRVNRGRGIVRLVGDEPKAKTKTPPEAKPKDKDTKSKPESKPKANESK